MSPTKGIEMMTPKENALLSLNHQTPSWVPLEFGTTGTTGMHVNCVAALREFLGLEKRPVKVHEPYQMLGWIDEDLQEALRLDVDGICPRKTMFGFPNEEWKPWRTPYGLEVMVSKHFNTTTDQAGNHYMHPEGDISAPPSGVMPSGGYFFDAIIRQDPIDEARLNPDDNLEEFGPIDDEDLRHFQHEIERLSSSNRLIAATFGGTAFGDIALVPAPFLKNPKGIRDIEEWYISTSMRQIYIHRVFEKQCEYALENLQRIHDAVGDQIDVVFICGTDFGTQTSTFCSEKTYRNLYMPYYKQVNDWIHQHTNWKTFKHSCGAVGKFINAFIESGFDVLNPVQCSAAGMEPKRIKDAYGERIVFWGGGVDTQKTLPSATPEEVRREVLERCEIFSQNGGFVFNSIHNVQADTPVENIVAMIHAVHEYNGWR